MFSLSFAISYFADILQFPESASGMRHKYLGKCPTLVYFAEMKLKLPIASALPIWDKPLIKSHLMTLIKDWVIDNHHEIKLRLIKRP